MDKFFDMVYVLMKKQVKIYGIQTQGRSSRMVRSIASLTKTIRKATCNDMEVHEATSIR